VHGRRAGRSPYRTSPRFLLSLPVAAGAIPFDPTFPCFFNQRGGCVRRASMLHHPPSFLFSVVRLLSPPNSAETSVYLLLFVLSPTPAFLHMVIVPSSFFPLSVPPSVGICRESPPKGEKSRRTRALYSPSPGFYSFQLRSRLAFSLSPFYLLPFFLFVGQP